MKTDEPAEITEEEIEARMKEYYVTRDIAIEQLALDRYGYVDVVILDDEEKAE